MFAFNQCIKLAQFNVLICCELVSEQLVASTAFTQCLPSWNVDSAAPFTVEIRTRPQGSDLWTPWLLIGDWGVAQRPAEVVTACDEARIAVDILEASSPQDRAQLRGPDGIGVTRTILCMTDFLASGVPPMESAR